MLQKLPSYLLSIFLFLFPLFTLNPFLPYSETDKQFILVLFSFLLLAVYLIKFIQNKELKLTRTPYDWLILMLPIISLFSSLLSSSNQTVSLFALNGPLTLFALAILYFSLTAKQFNITPLIISSLVISVLIIVSQFKPGIVDNQMLPSSFIFLLAMSIHFLLNIIFKNKNFKSFIIFLILTAGTLVSGFHLMTDKKIISLPFLAGWAIMMEAYKNISNFVIGIGPGNFTFAYTVGKPAFLNFTSFWNQTSFVSSNYFLTIAVESGIVAGLTLLFIFAKTALGQQKSHPFFPAFIVFFASLLLIYPGMVISVLTVVLLTALVSKKEMNINQSLPSLFKTTPYAVFLILVFIAFSYIKTYTADIVFRRSIVMVNSKKTQEAFRLSQQAIDLNPKAATYYLFSSNISFALAQELSAQKNSTDSAMKRQIEILTQKTVNDAKTAVNLNPLDAGAWSQLAQSYQVLPASDDSFKFTLDAYDRAIKLDPLSPVIKTNAGELLLQGGNLENARALFTQAINLKSDWPRPRYLLANVFYQSKDYKNASLELQQTLNLISVDDKDYKKIEEELAQVQKLIPQESTPSATTNTLDNF